MIAYNMGPGATDKWLASGADIRKLPKETQGYIRGVNLAEGGEVKRYAAGDYVDPFGAPNQSYDMDALRIQEIQAAKKRKEDEDRYEFLKENAPEVAAKMKPPMTKSTPARGKASPEEVEQFFSRFDTIPTTTKPVDNTAAQETTPKEKEFNLMEYIRERQARTDKASENDKNMALLSAGLGILGGTSPYAFENIGKGAQMGVQQLGQLQKLRASQDIAGDKILGSAYNAEMLNKIRRDQLAQGKEQRSDKLAQDLQIAKANEIGKRLKLKGITDEMIGMLEQKEMLKTIKPDELAKLNLFKQQMKKVEDDVSRLFPSTGTNSNYRLVGVR
jgi:hypothetical protein